ncbi:transketolase C-terminal domain-containing protein [[Clostridium] symbiosum]|uniref:transketolase family protein n=1 Tax=Clostridium symbiosum TaxID=1512 RepID=UPI001D0661E2|nr:transketolase C-terminal domain-containing protein [[Clostridium] symbiosum]MCB6610134.1 transketolase family protein [[Clostridium] symbiosum]MCB6930556.1 transketolase family protein [[Clostridium] symbiosum]
MIKTTDNICPESMEMRKAFCESLIELAGEDRNVIVMDGDLMGAMGTKPFAGEFPEQTLDCGIQEANAVGVAAGMSAVGKIPFVHSFGPFISRRACDQVFMSGAYAKLNVKLVGSDPGITAQINGGTHMPFEDMGIMRGIPQMTIVEPTDITMLRSVMRQMKENYGMYYMRLVRKSCMKIYEAGSEFEIGKAVILREGRDATVIASGYCVAQALKAAEELEREGVYIRVIDMFTWKPVDEETIVNAAKETGAIVTAENHNVINGLGSAVAETVVKHSPVPIEMIGVQDQFGEVGDLDYLAGRFGLKSENIIEAVKKAMKRKQQSREKEWQ